MSANLWAIGDIHGRNDLLLEVLAKLKREEGFDPKVDKLVVTGDMVDRGKDSKGVLDTLWKLNNQHPENVIVLAGNHEWLAIDAHIRDYEHDRLSLWLMNGGRATLESFGQNNPRLPNEYIKWMASLPLKHEEPGFFFSHAPVPREEDRLVYLKGQPFSKQELTWTYESPEDKYARDFRRDDGKDVVGVCGHIHQLRSKVYEPRFYDHYIFLDAGCGCSSKAPLAAVEVRSRRTVFAWPVEAQVTNSMEEADQ